MHREIVTKKDEIAAAKARLLEWIKPGDTVFTILRHTARSGMFRRISPVVLRDGGDVYHIGSNVAILLGKRGENDDGIGFGGCGMDFGFDLVYQLGAALWPQGFVCTGKDCPSNDHSNGDRNYRRHKHKSGGYALRQRWL